MEQKKKKKSSGATQFDLATSCIQVHLSSNLTSQPFEVNFDAYYTYSIGWLGFSIGFFSPLTQNRPKIFYFFPTLNCQTNWLQPESMSSFSPFKWFLRFSSFYLHPYTQKCGELMGGGLDLDQVQCLPFALSY